jgi:hypothetical protein
MLVFIVFFIILLSLWAMMVTAMLLVIPGRLPVASINPSTPVPLIVLAEQPEESSSAINEQSTQPVYTDKPVDPVNINKTAESMDMDKSMEAYVSSADNYSCK